MTLAEAGVLPWFVRSAGVQIDGDIRSCRIGRVQPTGAVAASTSAPLVTGQGIAPRAVRLVAERALNDLGITGPAIESDAANAASIQVAEKCDLQQIGSRVRTDVDRGLVTTIALAWHRP